jgi:hypothetical protein
MNTKIVPVAVYPSVANTLTIRSITLGPPPSYFYQLENVEVVPGSPAIPGTAEQLDPTTGAVIVPATDPVPAGADTTIVTVLKSGNVSMTAEQWAAWPADADDDKVQLDAISANLGLTRA